MKRLLMLLAGAGALGLAFVFLTARFGKEDEAPPSRMLSRLTRVELHRVDDGVSDIVGPLYAVDSGGLLASLSESRRAHGQYVTRRDAYLTCFASEVGARSSIVAHYLYNPRNGVFGGGQEWYQAPAAFRLWARKTLAATPRQKYRLVREYGGTSIVPVWAKSAPSLRFAMDNGDIQVLQVVDPKAIRPQWRDPAIRDIEVYWKQGGAPPKSIKEMKPAKGGLRGGEYQAMYRYDPKIRTYYYRARWVYEDYALDRLDPPGKYGPWGPLLTTKQGPYVAPWVKTAGKK